MLQLGNGWQVWLLLQISPVGQSESVAQLLLTPAGGQALSASRNAIAIEGWRIHAQYHAVGNAVGNAIGRARRRIALKVALARAAAAVVELRPHTVPSQAGKATDCKLSKHPPRQYLRNKLKRTHRRQ